MESGSRRSRVSEYTDVGIPRYGPASPFRGHLSTKSNAFCIDSSRSLTSQYLIRDHMVFHYNKILSAKAAVDFSVPKSRLRSIKLADQQRREKLKKKIARCEEEMSVGKTASRSSSRESGRLLPSSFGKDILAWDKIQRKSVAVNLGILQVFKEIMTRAECGPVLNKHLTTLLKARKKKRQVDFS